MLDQYCSMNTAKKGNIPIQLHLKKCLSQGLHLLRGAKNIHYEGKTTIYRSIICCTLCPSVLYIVLFFP